MAVFIPSLSGTQLTIPQLTVSQLIVPSHRPGN
jgi:hypothetical protein